MSIHGGRPRGEGSGAAPGTSESSPRSTDGTRWILVAAALLLLAAGLLVYLGIPSQSATTETQPFLSQRPDNDKQSAVDLLITLDSVDAAAGSVQARIVAAPGTTLPAEGAVVFSQFRHESGDRRTAGPAHTRVDDQVLLSQWRHCRLPL